MIINELRRVVPIVVSSHTPRICAVQHRGAFVRSKNSHCHDRNLTFVTPLENVIETMVMRGAGDGFVVISATSSMRFPISIL